jgi:outer membrane protein TolC
MFQPIAIAAALLATSLLAPGMAAADQPAADAPPRAASDVIAALQQQAERSNLGLANASLEVERSRAVLDAARARFFPEVSLNARYTRADGGRQITIPTGQLLNPAYQTLNELLVANGGTPRFPMLGDESFPLQLPREQDTRLSLRQPLYAPAIPAASAAARSANEAAGLGREAFRRALRRDVAIAYLGWLQASNAVRIVAASESLLAENLRVQRALYDQGKSTRDVVLRAEAEWLAVKQQAGEADNGARRAQEYVDFLLNRPLDEPLEPADVQAGAPSPAEAAPAGDDALLVARRPELRQLDAAVAAAGSQLRVAQSAWKPTLALGIDAGTEGTDYGLGRGYDYSTASLVLTWTLFDGGARSAAVAQARVARNQLANQREQAAQQLAMELRTASDNLRTARDSLATAQARAAAAQAAFAIAAKRRDAGMSSPLEYLDARSALTGALLNANQAACALLQRQAEADFARGEQP